MSIRGTEDPATIAYRWACSMGTRERPGALYPKASPDMIARQARDDANNRGADAWSPSRARERIRKWARPSSEPFVLEHAADVGGAFRSEKESEHFFKLFGIP